MFRDEICGGNFQNAWCPLNEYAQYWVFDYDPPLIDAEWPELWYDGRFGQNYMGGHNRFANLANGDFTHSRNSRTDGPPVQPGGSRDAILADNVHSAPAYEYQDAHAFGVVASGEEALKARRENDVAYGDGHVEIHNERPYYEGGFLTWEGAGWVPYGSERLQY